MLGGCEVGEAKITGGHKLPAKYVIHTVGPIGEDQKKLEECYKSCLQQAEKFDLRTVAFCGISTGIYGYPRVKAAHVALRTVRRWLQSDTNCKKVDRIIFTVFLPEEEAIYKKLAHQYFPPFVSNNNS